MRYIFMCLLLLLLLSRFSCVRLCATPWTAAPIPEIFQARVLEWGAIVFSSLYVYKTIKCQNHYSNLI